MSSNEVSIIFEKYEKGVKKHPFYAIRWVPGEIDSTAKLGGFRNIDDLMKDLSVPGDHKVKLYNNPVTLLVHAIKTEDSRDYELIVVSKLRQAVEVNAVELDRLYQTEPEVFIKTVKSIVIKI